MGLLKRLMKFYPVIFKIRNYTYGSGSGPCPASKQPRHLICFKQWTSQMVKEIIKSAINLKSSMMCNTHCKRMNVLKDCKVMILQEVNEPVLAMAVSKAATMLGAYDTSIIDHVVWEQDYNGRLFSSMADAIFVTTSTHYCIQRFASQSSVPVMCMRSRTHASIQSLATVMAIEEEFGMFETLNIAFIGPPHPVLNSYLLLCPMLGANIRFLCCCPKCPVSPLLLEASKELIKATHTGLTKCTDKEEALKKAQVIIAGPTTTKKEKLPVFTFTIRDIERVCSPRWIFFHTCPRGAEVADNIFYHENARTFQCFQNMQYIAGALLAFGIKKLHF